MLAVAVLGWRVLALLQPSPVVEIAPSMRIPLTAMGLGFLACGLVLRHRRGDALAAAFLRYCVGGAVHWGGLPDATGHRTAAVLVLAYASLSAMGDGGLLELALRMRRGAIDDEGSRFVGWAYLPALAGAALIPVGPWLSARAVGSAAALLLMVAWACSLAAGVQLTIVWLGGRPQPRLGPTVLVMWLASVLAAVGGAGALGPAGEVTNLLLLSIPIALAWLLSPSAPPPACGGRSSLAALDPGAYNREEPPIRGGLK